MATDITINIRGRLADFRRPWVMGIVNVTPDSFYSGSRTRSAVEIEKRVASMMADGADCIDVGGYSSRPGADEVSPDEEWSRVATALDVIRRRWPEAVVSVDTFRASVAAKCADQYGVDIINDIGGGNLDPEIWEVVASRRLAYVLMHMRGTPAIMQTLTDYTDITAEVYTDLAMKVARLRQTGVADIIIDPGFGFAKTLQQNYELLASMSHLKDLGLPVLAGLSRKSMIWKALGRDPGDTLEGTVALDTVALLNGADILRVHDVRPAADTVRLLSLMPGFRGHASGASHDKVSKQHQQPQ